MWKVGTAFDGCKFCITKFKVRILPAVCSRLTPELTWVYYIVVSALFWALTTTRPRDEVWVCLTARHIQMASVWPSAWLWGHSQEQDRDVERLSLHSHSVGRTLATCTQCAVRQMRISARLSGSCESPKDGAVTYFRLWLIVCFCVCFVITCCKIWRLPTNLSASQDVGSSVLFSYIQWRIFWSYATVRIVSAGYYYMKLLWCK